MKIELSAKQQGTIFLALSNWKIRCEQEAAQMEQWAIEMPAQSEKCLANAAASRQFLSDAEAVLEALRAA